MYYDGIIISEFWKVNKGNDLISDVPSLDTGFLSE